MLQRRFKIGYSRAGRIVDQMEARGLISGYEGSKPRQVLISKSEWQELKLGVSSNNSDTDSSSQSGEIIPNAISNPVIEDVAMQNSDIPKRSKYDIEL